jgi:hypothetical protein
MAWTSPHTWSVSELVTSTKLNEQLRDNMLALKDPPTSLYNVNEGADYTTTSDTFVDVDATDLSLTIVTGGGDVLVWFYGTVRNANGGGGVGLNFSVDGTDFAADDGLLVTASSSTLAENVAFIVLVQGLSAGSHTFNLRYRRNGGAGTAEIFAGAGTSNLDVHSQFGVREVS